MAWNEALPWMETFWAHSVESAGAMLVAPGVQDKRPDGFRHRIPHLAHISHMGVRTGKELLDRRADTATRRLPRHGQTRHNGEIRNARLALIACMPMRE